MFTLRFCTTEGFLQRLSLQFRLVPGPGQFRDDPDIRQYFKETGSAPFLVSPAWIMFHLIREEDKRYFE